MLGEVLKGGFKVWKSNLKLSIPFVLEIVVGGFITALFLVSVIYVALNVNVFDTSVIDKVEHIKPSILKDKGYTIAGLIFGYIVVLTVLNAFFKSWEIKACSDAIDDDLNLGKSLSYVRLVFKDLLYVSVIVGLLIILCAILIFVVFVYPFVQEYGLPSDDGENAVLFVISLLGSLTMFLIALVVIVFVFTYVPYAVVLDKAGVIGGIKKGVRVLKMCIGETFVLYLAIFGFIFVLDIPFTLTRLALGLDFSSGVPYILFECVRQLLVSAVVMPITTLWFVLMYKNVS